MKTLQCAYCGKEFTQNTYKQIYCCVECRYAKNNEQKNVRRGLARKQKKKVNDLKRIAIESRQAGMSYGQYVALKGI